MRSVVLIHGLLQGNGRQEPCEMLAIRETPEKAGPAVYSRCSVIDAPHDLPDGEYAVTFGGNIVPAKKEAGLWIPDKSNAAALAPSSEKSAPSRPSFNIAEAGEILSVLKNRVA
ncbi:MAG TPA: hypothetical protein VHE33_10750 [Acidobacteriaceae bacterium]|nr:hypothetical protein [Acidobacteriaceae bacterium]